MKNKNLKEFEFLDDEEREMVELLEKGAYKKLSQKEFEKQRDLAVLAAKDTLHKIRKDKIITLRINSTDLENIKRKAQAGDLPYQTLIGSVLHKYASR
jgi:predicted DNA binding CopG/RHH family protein